MNIYLRSFRATVKSFYTAGVLLDVATTLGNGNEEVIFAYAIFTFDSVRKGKKVCKMESNLHHPVPKKWRDTSAWPCCY